MRDFIFGSRKTTAVALSSKGLFLDDVHLIEKRGNNFFPLTQESSAFDQFLHKLTRLLEDGCEAEAIFLANFAPDYIKHVTGLEKANFNPSEPRDSRARWTNGPSAQESPLIHEVQYRGHFHDAVVEDLINGLSGHGSIAFSHVPVTGINGVTAIPDGASLPMGSKTPYFIEVKTGGDPPFTLNQMQVYPLICLGGHAVSADPRIAGLGLTPGATLPPMDIMIVHTLGPGLPMSFFSYCSMIGVGGFK